jgi:site-specific DNA-methyltransferase (adenine-specific)
MKLNTIYNEDCLETMKRMPDNFVDLIVTDPPYDISSSKPGNSELMSLRKYNSENFSALTSGFNIDEVLQEFKRITKKMNCFIFCSNNQIPDLMSWGIRNNYYTTLLVWNKTNSAPFANGVWRQDAEFIVHIREKGTYFDGNAELKRKVVQSASNPSEYGHPTEKPKRLISRYLRIGSDEGDLVYDPFMGSGTTARACKDLNRNYIGSEISKEYCDIAESRLKQEVLL